MESERGAGDGKKCMRVVGEAWKKSEMERKSVIWRTESPDITEETEQTS